jgi:hypothetical protein
VVEGERFFGRLASELRLRNQPTTTEDETDVSVANHPFSSRCSAIHGLENAALDDFASTAGISSLFEEEEEPSFRSFVDAAEGYDTRGSYQSEGIALGRTTTTTRPAGLPKPTKAFSSLCQPQQQGLPKKRDRSKSDPIQQQHRDDETAIRMMPKKKVKLSSQNDNNSIDNHGDWMVLWEAQQTLMNEPIEHDYDTLIAGYGLDNDHHPTISTTSAVQPFVANPMGFARKDIFDDDDDDEPAAAEEDGTEPWLGGGDNKAMNEPRVGLDSWQMHVLHRIMKKLPPQPQAVFKAHAAQAIDRHLEAREAKYSHLPGSIFEDVMMEIDPQLFLETYIAVRKEMHQLETVTAADIWTKRINNNNNNNHAPQPPPCSKTTSPLQLAMGYAFCLGMKHAQASSSSSCIGKKSSLQLDSVLEEANAKMNHVPPLERGRVWSELVEFVHGRGGGVFADGALLDTNLLKEAVDDNR